MDAIRGIFDAAVQALEDLVRPGEMFTCYFTAEESDFVRLNHNRVRQAGHVRQIELCLDLIEGQRHAGASLNLTGEGHTDRARLDGELSLLRAQLACLEDDPYLLYATEVHDTTETREYSLPDSAEALGDVMDAARGMDLVGIWASGPLYAGFANSLGQRNWYHAASFNFDWSCYHGGDKAVKGTWAGSHWEGEVLAQRMGEVREQLSVMARPPKTIEPGHYRVYLAPSALQEVLEMTAWGGFSLKSHRTAQTPLIKLARNERSLHPSVTIAENAAEGLAPRFTPQGYTHPDRVVLIEGGRYRDCLVSPRSGKEYGEPVNAGAEVPHSLDMAAGGIPRSEVLRHLDTGLYINNLWYANFSDQNDCRITAMTRFACFWVQDGEIQEPVNVMRLDESVYRMLGENLIGLTREREFIQESGTYGGRSSGSVRLPGALIDDFTFTL
jgi:predicted Zn-dependent protease